MNNTKILHIIHCLGNGGAARSMIATAKYSSELGSFEHIVMSLEPAKPDAMAMVKSAGITVINSPDFPTLLQAIENADIVQLHFWNNPQIYEFLRLELPPMRLILWFHIAGDNPPQVITQELVGFADCAIACNPYSSELPVFQSLPTEVRLQKTGMVYDGADLARLTDIKPQPHETFNVGYIGSVNFAKMHPNYVSMSSKINVPNIRFIVCGGDKQSYFKQQAGLMGTADRFEFRGFVENLKSVLEILDVYGYPLCPDTYAAAELNLQEAMYAGIPPVVFPYGGIKSLVMDNYTGLVVNSELEYQQAVEYLYHYPEERARIGKNAQDYARQIFGAENAAKKINQIYENLLKQPKRDREWGTLYGYPQINQPVNFKDVTGESENISGAELFIQALGETAPEFKISLKSDNVEELLAADKKIAKASMLLATGEGGISQYREYYEKDGYLRLWWALYFQEQGSYGKAVSELITAIELGCNNWRVVWYLAQAAVKINQISLAKKAITDVLQAVPDFAEAKTLLEYIESISEPESLTADQQQELAHQLRLRNINLIIFPDWTASEDALLEELATAIGAIASHPDKNNMTLLVDSTNISDEDADMAVSSIVMNLMLEQELDLESSPDICVIGQLSKIQWQALLPRIHGRIVLEQENKEAIASVTLENISVLSIENFCAGRAVESPTGIWELQISDGSDGNEFTPLPVIPMENPDLSADYWRYIEQACPNLDRSLFPHIVSSLKNTSWEQPNSALDFNNVAVLSLIEAENCQDSSMKEIYLEMAFEALNQGVEQYNHPLCAAHLALLLIVTGDIETAIPLVFSTWDDTVQAAYVNLAEISPGIVYLPRFSKTAIDPDLILEIMGYQEGYTQCLLLLREAIKQLQIQSLGRRDAVITYTKKRLQVIEIAVELLNQYIWNYLISGFQLLPKNISLGLLNLKLANYAPISSFQIIQAIYLMALDIKQKDLAQFWLDFARNDVWYNPHSLEWRWTDLAVDSSTTYIPFESEWLLGVEPTCHSMVTSILLSEGDWFEKEMEFWRNHIQPGMTAIDVGANVGVYSFSAARCVGSTGLVLAIEPFPGCVECLEETCEINQISWVKICAGAASDRNGKVRLSLSNSSELNAIITDDTSENINPESYLEVPCFTLDSLMEKENLKRVDFIKIDAEGHELSVLMGSQRILSQFSPVILYENIAGSQGSNLPVADYLRSHGYQLFRYQPYVGQLIPISDPADNLSSNLNIIAIPAQKSKF